MSVRLYARMLYRYLRARRSALAYAATASGGFLWCIALLAATAGRTA